MVRFVRSVEILDEAIGGLDVDIGGHTETQCKLREFLDGFRFFGKPATVGYAFNTRRKPLP